MSNISESRRIPGFLCKASPNIKHAWFEVLMSWASKGWRRNTLLKEENQRNWARESWYRDTLFWEDNYSRLMGESVNAIDEQKAWIARIRFCSWSADTAMSAISSASVGAEWSCHWADLAHAMGNWPTNTFVSCLEINQTMLGSTAVPCLCGFLDKR